LNLKNIEPVSEPFLKSISRTQVLYWNFRR